MENKLKSCPFCGRDNTGLTIEESYDEFNENKTYYIRCQRCGVTGRENRDKEFVVQKWNIRKG